MLTVVRMQLAYMRMMVSDCDGNVWMWSRKSDINFSDNDRSEACKVSSRCTLFFCTIHTYASLQPPAAGLHSILSAAANRTLRLWFFLDTDGV